MTTINLIPVFILIVTASVIMSRTLAGDHTGGWDINEEYRVMGAFNLDTGWKAGLYPNSNISSSLVVSWLLPFVSDATGIKRWLFTKLIIPLVYSFSPMMLYYAYRKYVGAATSVLLSMLALYMLMHDAMFDIRIMMGMVIFIAMILCMFYKPKLAYGCFGILFITYYTFAIMALPIIICFSLYRALHCHSKYDMAIVVSLIFGGAVWLNYSTAGFFFNDLLSYFSKGLDWRTPTWQYYVLDVFFSMKIIPIALALYGVYKVIRSKERYELLLWLGLASLPLLFLWQIHLWHNYEPYKAYILAMLLVLPFVGIAIERLLNSKEVLCAGNPS